MSASLDQGFKTDVFPSTFLSLQIMYPLHVNVSISRLLLKKLVTKASQSVARE